MNPTAVLDWLKTNKAQASAWVAAISGWAAALSGPGAWEWAAANSEYLCAAAGVAVGWAAEVARRVRAGQTPPAVPDLPPAPGGFTVVAPTPGTPVPAEVPAGYATDAGTVTVTSKEVRS